VATHVVGVVGQARFRGKKLKKKKKKNFLKGLCECFMVRGISKYQKSG
jgi:hypothetical protein